MESNTAPLLEMRGIKKDFFGNQVLTDINFTLKAGYLEGKAIGEDEVKKLESKGDAPIVVTSPIVRMYFKKLTSDYLKDLIVISYNEIDSEVELKSVGVITIHDN